MHAGKATNSDELHTRRHPPDLLCQGLFTLPLIVIRSCRGIASCFPALFKIEQAALHSLMLCLEDHMPSQLTFRRCLAWPANAMARAGPSQDPCSAAVKPVTGAELQLSCA